ncbi:MAG: YqaE/Pmp3 family membrane protein [Bacteroidetes bacterium]|jgi:uncharacterized membrane protein YqaE (UPF0057 family)|nr:YqaE/Pmp3 family membrane protein [Bacteroidota bacterium]
MKKLLFLLAFALCAVTSQAAVDYGDWAKQMDGVEEVKTLPGAATALSLERFLTLTPKQYREMTGERLGLKNAIKLKAAQKIVKRQLKRDEDLSKGLYVLLAILGFGWLAMGLLSDWDGSDWIVNLVLTFLCWLPGLIHALVKMKDYY